MRKEFIILMMKKKFDLSWAIEGYFNDYLVKERGSSKNTIRSYRDTMVQYIQFLEKQLHINPDRITIEHFNKKTILEYLYWIENEHNNCIATRNQRTMVFRSFANYMQFKDLEHMKQWKEIKSISKKSGPTGTLSYLTLDEITILLSVIDITTIKGRRDLTLLSLLYNSAARVQELIDLTPASLRLSKPYSLEIVGKGNKTRIIPLNEDIVRLIERYLLEHGLNHPGKEYHPLFYNAWHEKLSSPGVTYILMKYFKIAKTKHPELFRTKISPHVLRHSRAMHLLQAGVNIVYIRDFLGHRHINTTEIYARVDSNLSRKAIEGAMSSLGIKEPETKSWEKNSKLKDYLKSLA